MILLNRQKYELLFQSTALTLYLAFGFLFIEFYRIKYAFFVSVGTSILAEIVISFFLYKKFKLPLGAYIVGISYFLLVQSTHIYGYVIGGIVGQVSKHFFRVSDIQIFNPSNIALIFAVYVFSNVTYTSPEQWNGDWQMIALALIVGILVTLYAKKITIVFSYMIVFLIMSAIRSYVTGSPYLYLAGTVIGIPQIIFACHMITDPQTSPQKPSLQFIFGAAIAILDVFLRWNSFLNPVYLSLIIVCLGWVFVRPIWDLDFRSKFKKSKKQYWALFFIFVIVVIAANKHVLRLENYDTALYSASRNKVTPTDFIFSDEAKNLGIKHSFECFTPDSTNKNVIERLCRPNASVIVSDINNDGYPDVFFNTMKEDKPNKLYLNKAGKKFIDVSDESGISQNINAESPSTGAIFFDYDNDGYNDLFIIRAGCHVLYKNLDGLHFKDVSAETGVDKICGNAVSINAFDYDLDGYLDVYIGNWWPGIGLKNLNISIMPAGSYSSKGGASGVLLKNINGKKFVDVTSSLGLEKKYHTWAVGISDFNNDGYPDLFLANDHMKSVLYLNQKGLKFLDFSSEAGINSFGRNAMSAEIADFENNGSSSIFVTDTSLNGIRGWGNSLLSGHGNGSFKNVSRELGTAHCGWAWGAKFVDLNRDGWLDIFVTSGFWGGGSKKSYMYTSLTNMSLPSELQKNQDFQPDTRNFSFAADNKNCVYLRDISDENAQKFIDVTVATNVDEAILGKGVATLDFDNNGTMDIIVARSEGSPKVYKNTIDNKNHWIGFKLVGKNNSATWGARLKVITKKITQSKELYPANGFKSQSDSRLFFGLGNLTEVDRIEILWPSGKKQSLKNYTIDQYQIVTEE